MGTKPLGDVRHLLTGELEQLSDGHTFTEGPVWSPREECLFFTDVPHNTIYRWTRAGGIEAYRQPSDRANGMTVDRDGLLIACEHLTLSVTRTELDGTRTTLADNYQGKELNGPNDVIVRSDGTIYFSDPWSTRVGPPWGVDRPAQLDFQGLFMIPAGGGDVVAAMPDFVSPNGLALSPDESILYANDSKTCEIRAFDVAPDGGLSNSRVIGRIHGEGSEVMEGRGDGARFPPPDGMKVDVEGNVYCTGPFGVWVFTPAGEHLGIIEVPTVTGNFAFGGPDGDTMFICATSHVYAQPMTVRGAGL